MKRIFCFLSALTVSLAAAAQTATPAGVTAQGYDADSVRMYTLQAATVISTRVTETSPVAFSNIAAEQIERNNYGYDMPSLLRMTPSIVATSEAGTGVGNTSFSLRGSDATRINVTANGVPMNDPASHKLYWVDTPDLASSVGNVQIQRGAGTSTNGTGAFGGTVNMTTAPLATSFNGSASLSYGSYNTNKQSVQVGSGLMGGHWAVDGRLSHIGSDGYIDRASANLRSYMLQAAYYSPHTVVRLVSFGGWEKTYLTYNGVTKEQMQTNRRYNSNGEIWHADGSLSFYDDQTDNYRQFNNQLIVTHVFSERWTLNATAHYTSGYGYYNQYKGSAKMLEYGVEPFFDAAGGKVRHDLTRRKSMQNDFYGAVASVNYTSPKVLLSLGGACNYYDGSHWGNIMWIDGVSGYDTARQYYRNTVDKLDGNVFAKINWQPIKGLDVYGDVQYRHVGFDVEGKNDNYNDAESGMQSVDAHKKYDFVNPKAGVSYTFARQHTFYASYAIARREPSRGDFTDRFTSDYPKAEMMQDWEVGYAYRGGVVEAGVNFYYMKYKDQMVTNGLINVDTDDALNINVPDSYRRGVELTLAARATRWLTVGANATFSQNRIKDFTDKVIDYDTYDYRQTYIGTTTISYSPSTIAALFVDFHVKGFAAELHTQYVGKQYLNNSRNNDFSLDEYCVTNLNLSYTMRNRQKQSVRFGVSINNLLNSEYCDYGYGYSYYSKGERSDTVLYFPQATLNVLANVTVKF